MGRDVEEFFLDCSILVVFFMYILGVGHAWEIASDSGHWLWGAFAIAGVICPIAVIRAVRGNRYG